MLADCAPGHAVKRRDHNFCVTFRGRSFPQLPTGAHGSKDPEIQLGHVRQMVRQLELAADCVNRSFPDLVKTSK
jgi:hypothetical protein